MRKLHWIHFCVSRDEGGDPALEHESFAVGEEVEVILRPVKRAIGAPPEHLFGTFKIHERQDTLGWPGTRRTTVIKASEDRGDAE